MEIYVKKICDFHIFSFVSGFQPRCYLIHWFYQCHNFNHNNWLRHKL